MSEKIPFPPYQKPEGEKENLKTPGKKEEFIVFEYKDGELNVPKTWFEEQTIEIFPHHSNKSENGRIIELGILDEIGETIQKWLKLKSVEELHNLSIWKSITKIVENKVGELLKEKENSKSG